MEEEEEGKIFGQRAEGGGYNAGFPHNNADCAKARRRFHKKNSSVEKTTKFKWHFYKIDKKYNSSGAYKNLCT